MQLNPTHSSWELTYISKTGNTEVLSIGIQCSITCDKLGNWPLRLWRSKLLAWLNWFQMTVDRKNNHTTIRSWNIHLLYTLTITEHMLNPSTKKFSQIDIRFTFYLRFHIIFIQHVFVHLLLQQSTFLSEWIFMPRSLSHLYSHQHINLSSINKPEIHVNKFQTFSRFLNVPDNMIRSWIKKQLG